MLKRSPTSMSDSANGSAASTIATTEPSEQQPDHERGAWPPAAADELRGPDEVRFLGGSLRDAEDVHDEDRDQHRASTSVSVDFSGSVSPYSVASTRNAISTECDRSRHDVGGR